MGSWYSKYTINNFMRGIEHMEDSMGLLATVYNTTHYAGRILP